MKWQLHKRLWVWLGVLLPLVPCAGTPYEAEWQPRRLAVGVGTDDGITANLGFLQDVSEHRLLFLSGSYWGFYFFKTLNTNGHVTRIKVAGLWGGAQAQFISDHEALVWGTGSSDDKRYYRITGKILDCQQMRVVKYLQDGPAIASNGSFVSSRGQDSVLLVNTFSALEWSLKSGHLIHRWKFSKSKDYAGNESDDSFITDTTYAPRTDTFVQMIAGRIQVWGAKTGQIIRTSAKRLPHFKSDYNEGDPPSTVHFSLDAELIVYDVGRYGPLRIARCDTAQVLWYIPDYEIVPPTRFSPDGRKLYFYSEKRHRFTVFQARTGRVLRYLPGPPGVDQFWVSPDGKMLYSEHEGAIWWQRAC